MQVRLLGPVDVLVDGVPRPVAGLRRKAVLAVLGLAAGHAVSTDRLIDVVWAGEAPATAGNALQSHVSYLRGVLGNRTAIVARPPGYALDLPDEPTDVVAAERLIARAQREADPARGAEHLRVALALWRGTPLGDTAGLPWLDEQADRLTRLRLQLVQDLIDVRLAAGEHARLIPELEHLTAEEPFLERLHGQLMLALYRAGRQADALAAYQRVRRRLGDELGIDPGPALRDLEAAILRQDSSLGTPSAPAVSVVSPPAQLPAPVPGFVGREAQLRQLDAFLTDGSRTPTLIIGAIGGTAGVGKTTLAVHWAHRVRAHFPDGQLYVNLRGYADSPPVLPGPALAQFLRALGVPPERVPLDVDEAAALFRTLVANRRMLLILDNAAGPEQVRPLLPGSPSCLVLVTSRDRLGGLVVSEGARLLALDVLDPEEAQDLLAGLVGQPRASAEPAALVELARVCGHLPLALRIAAANLMMRPNTTIAHYLRDLGEGNRLAELSVGGDAQSAVRATFDLSYAALDPVEQQTFRLLGLVPGPDIDLRAAAALTGRTVEQTRRALSGLVDGHLILEPAPGRYGCHDLLRLYARSLVDAEETAADRADALARLGESYRAASDVAADLLYPGMIRLPATIPTNPADAPFTDVAGALDWLDTERANLVALVSDPGPGPTPAIWHLADNLRGYFSLRRDADDWHAVAAAVQRAGTDHPGALASAQLSFAQLANAQGHRERAIELVTEAHTLAERAGWHAGAAAALNNLAVVHSMTGRHREAADLFLRSAETWEAQGRLVGQAISLDNLGIVKRELGDLEMAVRLHLQAIALHRQTGFPLSDATALTNLAAAHADLGHIEQARQGYTRSLEWHEQTGNIERQAICRYGLAGVHLATGEPGQAEQEARAAVALAREIGDPRTEANALIDLALVHAATGRAEAALDGHRHALRLAAQSDSRLIRARALVGVAGALIDLGALDAALATATEALTLIRDNGYALLEVDARTVVAEVHIGQSRFDDAADVARDALAACRRLGYGRGEPRILRALAAAERSHALPAAD